MSASVEIMALVQFSMPNPLTVDYQFIVGILSANEMNPALGHFSAHIYRLNCARRTSSSCLQPQHSIDATLGGYLLFAMWPTMYTVPCVKGGGVLLYQITDYHERT